MGLRKRGIKCVWEKKAEKDLNATRWHHVPPMGILLMSFPHNPSQPLPFSLVLRSQTLFVTPKTFIECQFAWRQQETTLFSCRRTAAAPSSPATLQFLSSNPRNRDQQKKHQQYNTNTVHTQIVNHLSPSFLKYTYIGIYVQMQG